jgi:hypothetical protein
MNFTRNFKKRHLSKNILFITIIVFFIYKIWDKILSFLGGTPLNRLNTLGATFSNAKAQESSEALYVAMHTYGTDEEKIYFILKDISSSNFNKIYNHFGKKLYQQESGIDGVPFIDTKLDLMGWLHSELNQSELDHLAKIAPKIYS